MIGFGGHNNKQKYYNGVFILEKGSASDYHARVLKKKMLIILVTADKVVVWKTPKINGIPPSPRSSHSATAVGDRLFVFGGFDGRRYYNDLHILDLGTPHSLRLVCSVLMQHRGVCMAVSCCEG